MQYADYNRFQFSESPPQNVLMEDGLVECDHPRCLHANLLIDGPPTNLSSFKFDAKNRSRELSRSRAEVNGRKSMLY